MLIGNQADEDSTVAHPLAATFWKRADRRGPDECWLWTGSLNPKGYGRILASDGSTRSASQVSWEIENGQDFPQGKLACHSCDNPPCVNPAHIWPGTSADNRRDAVSKGRIAAQTETHCAHGHEFTPENTYVRPRGDRTCRVCREQWQINHYVRKAAASASRASPDQSH